MNSGKSTYHTIASAAGDKKEVLIALGKRLGILKKRYPSFLMTALKSVLVKGLKNL